MFKDNLGYITIFKSENKDEEKNLNTGQEKAQVTTTENSNKTFSCRLVRSLADSRLCTRAMKSQHTSTG